MATVISRLRGTAAILDTQTLQVGVIAVDTTNNSLRLYDGVTLGGHEIVNKSKLGESLSGPLADLNNWDKQGLIYHEGGTGDYRQVVLSSVGGLEIAEATLNGQPVLVLRLDSSVPSAGTEILAGDGLDGGGPLSGNVNLSVDNTVVRTSRLIQTPVGSGLTGGGNLGATLNLAVDNTVLRTPTSDSSATDKYLRADRVWASPKPADLGITANAEQLSQVGRAFSGAVLVGEKVNYAPAGTDFTDKVWWPDSVVQNGITATGTNGEDEKGQYRDIRFTGQAVNGAEHYLAYQSILRPGVAVSGQWTSSIKVERVAGSSAGIQLAALRLFIGNSAGEWTRALDVALDSPAEKVYSVTNTFSGSESRAIPAFLLEATSGLTVDVTYRIRDIQLDPGAERKAYRFLPVAPAAARAALGVNMASLPSVALAGPLIQLTAIPPDVNRVTVFFRGMGITANTTPLLRLMTAAGTIATRYKAHCLGFQNGNYVFGSGNGPGLYLGDGNTFLPGLFISGHVALTRAKSNLWMFSGIGGRDDTGVTAYLYTGDMDLGSAALTGIALMTPAGAFSAGESNLVLEY